MTKVLATVLTTAAFIGEIRKHVKQKDGETGEQKTQYFVKVTIPHGSKAKRKYQYLSCYVTPELHRLFESTLTTQVIEEDGKAVHTLSAQIASVEIEAPFFEYENGFLNGSGILKSVVFS